MGRALDGDAMNRDDLNLGGDWPAVPSRDEGWSGCRTVFLILGIVFCLLVIATSMAVFAGRGCR